MTEKTSPELPETPPITPAGAGADPTAPNPPAPNPTATEPEPGFGWTAYAERLNGRFAMVGLVLMLLLELFTHQDFVTWVGLR